MSATEITAIFGILVALASSVVVPLLLRRQDRQQRERDADDAAEAARAERRDRAGERETVTLQSINKAVWDDREAIKRDRDELTVRSEAREETHRAEIKQLEEENRAAIARIRTECDAKIAILRNRVRDLEEEVANLYRDQGAMRRPVDGR